MAIVKWGFRRFYSSRQVVTGISELVAGSNVQQSERSSAASVTSKRPSRRKLALAARKKMLESFVDKYRSMNQGKFPSPSSARKEVGGGYYRIKKMIQEMEYNVKVSSVEKEPIKENKSKTITKEIAIESSSESQAVLDIQITMDQKVYEDRGESVSNLDTNFDFKEELQPSTSNADTGNSNVTRDDTLDIVTECHDRQGQFHEKLEQNLEDESLLGNNFAFKDTESTERHDEIQSVTSDIPEQQKDEESKAEQQHDETHVFTSDIPEQQKDEKLREKPSLWGNLKMLATGLINIWKK